MRDQELEGVVAFGLGGFRDFVGHEIGEHLLHPHIVEPTHRHQIAKPHVGRFVRQQLGAAGFLVLGGPFVQKQTRGFVLNRPGVLHAAVLKIRDGDEVEFLKRVLDLGVVF